MRELMLDATVENIMFVTEFVDEQLEQVYFTETEPVITYKKKEVHLSRMKLGKRDGKGSKLRL